MFRTYAHLTNADIDWSILEISGMPLPAKKKPRGLRPVVCRAARSGNGLGEQFCSVCGTDLTGVAKVSKEQMKQWIRDNPKISIEAGEETSKEGGEK
jgi:hypothetical protein